MEKRGIRFKIPNTYGVLVYEVLKPIEVEDYQWFIDWVEIYGEDINWEFTQPHIEEGSKLKERIMQGEYNIIFGKFIAFPQGEKVHDFEKYEDFLKSKAELVLLIVDVSYYDIYCKDAQLIELLYQNAQLNRFEEIEYIDETDARYRLSVY